MQTRKRILSCLAALCLTVLLLGGLTWLTQKKDSYAKHAEFFEQDADYDVFFVGSSRPMNGIFPMELWENYGIVSYNWAQAGHPPPAYYWVMRLALDYKQPKLMVIDCYGMHFDAKTTGVFGLMHISMDSFPLSLTKIRAVRDMLDDPSMTEEYNEGERRSAFNLLWTFPVFHSRWNQLTQEDYRPTKNYTRGAIANGDIFGGEFVPDDSEKGRVFDTVERDGGQYDQPAEVHWATGAALLVRSSIYKEVGGLDCRFFAHQEEIEMCWRMRIRGYQIFCLPESKVYHVGGGTLPKGNPMKTYLNFRNNLTMLYKCLPAKDLQGVMRRRWWLDYMAAWQTLLLNRNWGDFKAIFRARRDFRRWRKDFEADRRQIAQSRVGDGSAECVPLSILWQYYAKGKKRFSDLPRNTENKV